MCNKPSKKISTKKPCSLCDKKCKEGNTKNAISVEGK